MISKSPKEINRATLSRLQAEGVEIDEETVNQFNLFLFGKINNLLFSLETLELYVPQLGVWKFRRKKGEKYLSSIQNLKPGLISSSPEIAQKAEQTYQERLNKLNRLIERHEEMIIARREFKKVKDEYSSNKRRLEEPQEDLGRSEEQDLEAGTHRDHS